MVSDHDSTKYDSHTDLRYKLHKKLLSSTRELVRHKILSTDTDTNTIWVRRVNKILNEIQERSK